MTAYIAPRALRDYQIEAAGAVEHAWVEEGRKRVGVVLPTGTGKELPVDTPIPTPDGFQRLDELVPGDVVFGPEGSAVTVTHVVDNGIRPVYRVAFSDGTSILSGPEHQWEVSIHNRTVPVVMTTEQMLRGGLRHYGGGYKFSIPVTKPVAYSHKTLAHTPYQFGVDVGQDGKLWRSSVALLDAHLHSAVDDRAATLAGIIDATGRAKPNGVVIISAAHEVLQVAERLVWSLGGTAIRREGNYTRKNRTRRPHLHVWLPPEVTVPTKEVVIPATKRSPRRSVVSITPEGDEKTRCITVDHPRGLYLAGNEYIVTHNSTVIAELATRARIEGKKVVLLAHRTELLDQMAGAVQAVDPMGQAVGIVAADRDESGTDIVAATFQTLSRSPRRMSALGHRDVIIADECFPAGTKLANGQAVETVRVGDFVRSWDEKTQRLTYSRVVDAMRSVPSGLVRVVFYCGDSMVCTPGHPFLTFQWKWLEAAHLKGCTVLRETEPGSGLLTGSEVVRVENLEPGDDGLYGGACPDGYVYNFEVEDTHTYLMDGGVVVHNCHHISAPTYLKVLEDMGALDDGSGVVSCGFTATMARDDGKALGEVWGEVVFERDLVWAIANGFLIPPRGKTVAVEGLNRLAAIKNVGGDYKQTELSEVMGASVPSTVDAILRHCPNSAMIVFAVSVDHARTLAEMLTAYGVPARDVTGAHNREYRETAYADFREGRLNCLVTVQVLTEGADFPRCDTVVLARPTRSRTLLTQIIGRAVRPYTDPVTGLSKTTATVLDLTGVVRDTKLISLTDLFPESERRFFDEGGTDVTEDEEVMETLGYRKKERKGRLELEDVDLLGISTQKRSKVLWLRTNPLNVEGDEVAFMPLKYPREYVFVYPPVNRIGDDGVMLGRVDSEGRVTFMLDPSGNPVRGTLSQAVQAAEQIVGPKGYIRTDAGWRGRNSPPSQAQVTLGKNLAIPDVDAMTRAELSDRISTVFATRVFSGVIRKYPT
jgi:superfamily II DNA or RNA helicase